ncbi:hypothetical protein WJX72_011247 [[Myrmecia] bisecta]|uniref:Acetyl-coenzyme A transporter 1 n=1 Tax=[Myrmecia] bisecta TaxID=41462 RepID=A0AAW1P576_9CHLO
MALPARRRPSSASDLTQIEEGSSVRHLHPTNHNHHTKAHTVRDELGSMVLLVVLYMMQGVPLGLTMGSMPFLLQAKVSYTQIGIFSVASYPYSFKLLWSPIVDSVYSLAFGRRKSWVVPIQLLSALLLLGSAGWAEERLAEANIVAVTGLFFGLVLLAATQDIAVDGWALTLLSRKYVGYASTCQTVGMNIGYFTSFTLFLALNDTDFCNNYLRAAPQPQGIVTLGSYLRFWGWFYIFITLIVALFKSEINFRNPTSDGGEVEASDPAEKPLSLREAYGQLWGVVKLRSVQRLALILVTFRLGMLPAEQAAPLKLLEKGVSKEALAGLVLLEFPCELVSAVMAGRWAAAADPFVPWIVGYRVRLVMAAVVTTLVFWFPPGAQSLGDHPLAFLGLAVCGLITSFTATLMFTAIGSFYNRISDPHMGGAYLTLLNTIANIGIIVPKLAIFALMDVLTKRECQGAKPGLDQFACPVSHHQAKEDNVCTDAGGQCVVVRDGYYPLSYAMVLLGLGLMLHFQRSLPRLERLPLESWRAKSRTL